MNDTRLVVNFPPPHQGSVLGRVVAESRLGQLLRLISLQIIALKRSYVEISALRANRETLFSYDVEPSSGKSALELCCETLTRVQDLNRRITLYQYPEDRIERSGKFYYFLIRLAGIAGGDVAASKFMDDRRNDRRIRDYKAEAECPNYLIGSITLSEEEEERCNHTWGWSNRIIKRTPDGGGRCAIPTKEPDYLANTNIETLFHQVTPEDVDWGKRQGRRAKPLTIDPLTNFCPHRGAYVAQDHVCLYIKSRGAEPCVEAEVKREKTLDEHCAEFTKNNHRKVAARGRGPKGLNHEERTMVAHLDRATEFDLDIIEDKLTTGTPLTESEQRLWNRSPRSKDKELREVIRNFNGDQSRKGNKYRIR